MLYITGDLHGVKHCDFDKLVLFAEENKGLTKNDYVLVCGDCGVLFLEKDFKTYIAYMNLLPFTILFVDGNHENFDALNKYPVEEWKGGNVHKISPSIIHLMRGEVFNICGKKIFTFGGAESIDKDSRTPNFSWWEQEKPSEDDYTNAINKLKKYNNKVDYVITHCIDEGAFYYPLMAEKRFRIDYTSRRLSYFEDIIDYDHWYFGHYHIDGDVTSKKTCVYSKMIKLCE